MVWQALGSLFGSAAKSVGTGLGKIGTGLGDWASGGFGMMGGGEGAGAEGAGAGGGLGSNSLLMRLGSALFGGQNKRLENTAMAYRRAYEGSEPFYDQARSRFEPYSQQGLRTTGLINSLLGFGETPGTPGQMDYSAYLAANPDVASYFKNNPDAVKKFGGDINKAAQYHYETYGRDEGREMPMTGGVPGTSATAGGEGLARFREGLGYQDTLNQALGGIATNAAARGLLGSSGTGKAFQEGAARLAQGTYGNYLDQLLGQQALGANAAAQMGNIDLGQGTAKGTALFGEHATRGQKKSSFLSKLFG